jgi:HAD superfamily hydrolase (TIGR01509 family)
MHLAQKRYWIFDMDGTLTVPAHDFDAIRRELGLSLGRPILEQLADLPVEEAEPLYQRLDQIEREIAGRAAAQPGVNEFLAALRERRRTLGIVTRNSHPTALNTLRACGLDRFFEPDYVMSRERCTLKPSGDGIRKLLAVWGASPDEAVMVGDYLFDIMAGRDAGTATVFIDNLGRPEFAEQADWSVRDLHDLLVLVDHSDREDSSGGVSNDRKEG